VVVVVDVDVDKKCERRREASLPAYSILKDYIYVYSYSIDYSTVLRNNYF